MLLSDEAYQQKKNLWDARFLLLFPLSSEKIALYLTVGKSTQRKTWPLIRRHTHAADKESIIPAIVILQLQFSSLRPQLLKLLQLAGAILCRDQYYVNVLTLTLHYVTPHTQAHIHVPLWRQQLTVTQRHQASVTCKDVLLFSLAPSRCFTSTT